MKHVDLQKQCKGKVGFEIKGVQPTWPTNPTNTIYGGYLNIE